MEYLVFPSIGFYKCQCHSCCMDHGSGCWYVLTYTTDNGLQLSDEVVNEAGYAWLELASLTDPTQQVTGLAL